MARIRTIKPDFFKHEGLAELSPLHRLLFQGLWILADREGRLKDRPLRIKAEIFPYDGCDVDAMLNALADHRERFIIRYVVDDERYIQISNFLEHQRPNLREPESTIPPAPQKAPRKKSITSKPSSICAHVHSTDALMPGAVWVVLGMLGKGKGKGKGKEGNGDAGSLSLEAVVSNWNDIPGVLPMKAITGPIRERVAIRLREHPTPDWWGTLFDRVKQSDFLCGRKTDFAASLDWVLGPKNLAKIMAGNYDNRGEVGGGDDWRKRFLAEEATV